MSLLAGAALGLQVFGQLQQNESDAAAARDSAQWLKEQAAFFRVATDREKSIFERDVRRFKANTEVITAANGIELTGSFLDSQAHMDLIAQIELDAIEQQGQMNIREANLKAQGLIKRANRLNSFEHNFIQTAATVVGSQAFASLVSSVNIGPKRSNTPGGTGPEFKPRSPFGFVFPGRRLDNEQSLLTGRRNA